MSMNDVFIQGWEAAKSGTPMKDNPYHRILERAKRVKWFEGWQRGQALKTIKK